MYVADEGAQTGTLVRHIMASIKTRHHPDFDQNFDMYSTVTEYAPVEGPWTGHHCPKLIGQTLHFLLLSALLRHHALS